MKNLNLASLLYPFISSSLFIFISCYIILNGHLHEDAYILFIYVEHLINHGFIGYSLGTGPAEGATDFFWMIMLSGLYFLGIDLAWGAMFLNSLGVFLLVYILSLISFKYSNSHIFPFMTMVFIPVSYLSQASLVGFSVALYSSFIATFFYLILFSKNKLFIAIPAIGLILALVRPDGAIFGILGSLIFALSVGNKDRKKYLISVFVSCAIGISYFWIRWSYFGEILPLPLIVKSSSDAALPGVYDNFKFLVFCFVFFLAGFLGFLQNGLSLNRKLSIFLPIFVYFISISMAVQSQNVGLRFQAPILVTLLMFTLIYLATKHTLLKNLPKKLRSYTLVSFILFTPVFAICFYQTKGLIKYSTNSDYINYFPYYLSNYVTPDTNIALTEAGRLAYWIQGNKYDLVGLNTVDTAISGASVQYIKQLEPDLIMAHHAGLLGDFICSKGEDYCMLGRAELKSAAIRNGSANFLRSADRVKSAAAATIEYLLAYYEQYHVFSVRYGSSYTHIYGIRNTGSVSISDFIFALKQSFQPDFQLSHAEMKSRIR